MCRGGGAITHGGTLVMGARSITNGTVRCARLGFVLTLPLLVLILIFVSTTDVSAASIKLAWDPSPEPLVTGYRLYYGRSSGVYAVVVDAGNRTDYTVTGLDAGLTYYFTATAYTGAGDESTFSNETSYTIPGSSPAPTPPSASSSSGGGCFIATAAYGSGLAPEVVTLREFRDRYLLTNGPGQVFVEWYYRVSPNAAAFIAEHESLRTACTVGAGAYYLWREIPGSGACGHCADPGGGHCRETQEKKWLSEEVTADSKSPFHPPL